MVWWGFVLVVFISTLIFNTRSVARSCKRNERARTRGDNFLKSEDAGRERAPMKSTVVGVVTGGWGQTKSRAHTGAHLRVSAPKSLQSPNLCVAVHCRTLQSLLKAEQKRSALPKTGHPATPLSGLFKAWIYLHEINKSCGSSSAVLWQKVSSPRCSLHLSPGHPVHCALLWW